MAGDSDGSQHEWGFVALSQKTTTFVPGDIVIFDFLGSS
jgi:hypothetical protein